MFRIDDPSAAASLPAPEAAGTEGYWTEGNPGSGVPATLERASWFNMVQEELRAVVVAAGLTPSKTAYNQLLSAINALRTAAFTGSNQQKAITGYQKLPGGVILQWGTGTTDGSGYCRVNMPAAFPTQGLTCYATPISAVFTAYTASTATQFPNYFDVRMGVNGTPAAGIPFNWFAIGY